MKTTVTVRRVVKETTTTVDGNRTTTVERTTVEENVDLSEKERAIFEKMKARVGADPWKWWPL